MTIEQILQAGLTKTDKAKKLFELGKTRKEVAELLNCNYGMIQNIYARTYPDRIKHRGIRELIEEATWTLTNFEFTNKFGIEIEAFGIDRTELATELTEAGIPSRAEGYTHRVPNAWRVTTDSSLQGTNPFELVSPILQGEQGLRTLKTATHILKGMEAKVNKTGAVHIHLSAEGFTLATWKRLYKNYARLERLIDGFMPNSRRANNSSYCRSIRVEHFELKIDAANSLEQIEQEITNRDRYYKLNTQCFWRQKSVEFRQHSGTINYKKISNWIIFLARLVEFSKTAEVTGENWEACKAFLPDELINYFKQRTQELA